MDGRPAGRDEMQPPTISLWGLLRLLCILLPRSRRGEGPPCGRVTARDEPIDRRAPAPTRANNLEDGTCCVIIIGSSVERNDVRADMGEGYGLSVDTLGCVGGQTRPSEIGEPRSPPGPLS